MATSPEQIAILLNITLTSFCVCFYLYFYFLGMVKHSGHPTNEDLRKKIEDAPNYQCNNDAVVNDNKQPMTKEQ
jgi:hypothetical protein